MSIPSRAVFAVSCALLAWPVAPAFADDAPVPAGPADGAHVRTDTPLALNARAAPAAGAVWLHVSALATAVEPCGAIAGDVVRAEGAPVPSDPSHFSFPAAPRTLTTAGTYFWQVHVRTPDGGCVPSAVRRLVVAPAGTASAGPSRGVALPRLAREPIPTAIGESNHATLAIRVGDLPASVGRSRFVTLVRNGAARWRLRVSATLDGRPIMGDGRSEVGFDTRQVAPGALATTHVRSLVRYRSGPSRRTPVERRVVERDIFIRADVTWQAGPAYPDAREVDLQTVLLHELGHFSGNRRHTARGCRNTPMIVALDTGEWWRSSRDFSFRGCGPSDPPA